MTLAKNASKCNWNFRNMSDLLLGFSVNTHSRRRYLIFWKRLRDQVFIMMHVRKSKTLICSGVDCFTYRPVYNPSSSFEQSYILILRFLIMIELSFPSSKMFSFSFTPNNPLRLSAIIALLITISQPNVTAY